MQGDQGSDAIFSKKCKKRTNGGSFVNLPATSARHIGAADDDDYSAKASDIVSKFIWVFVHAGLS